MRHHLSSLRLRTTLVSTVAVAAVLLLSLLLLALGVRATLIANAVDAAQLRAGELAQLAVDGTLPPVVASGSDDEETFVQVVIDDRVVASSGGIEGEAALQLPTMSTAISRTLRVEDLPFDEGESFELVSRSFEVPATDSGDAPGVGLVHIGISVETIEEFAEVLVRAGLAGIPLILLILGAVLWRVTGRTLQPIEQLRRRAASIGGATLGERVPVPPTDDEVARLAMTLNEMLDRLQTSAVKQERFASDAAHELRSPLASLRVQLEATRDANDPVDWERVSADLLDETLRMQRLTEQLLSLVALGPERIASTARDVDLEDVVADVVTQVRETAPEGVTVTVGELALARVRGVPSLLALAVRNLAANAVSHAAGEVLVSLNTTGGAAVVCVEDDGPGIPEDEALRVFDPFVRLDEGRARQQGGAGLGLALVRDVAIAHGGQATAGRSSALGGARMKVRIPLADQG